MRRAFIDANVALDLLQAREPHVADALHVFALAEQGQFELLLSTDSLSTIFYVVEKNRDAQTAREALSKLLDYVTLCALDESSVLRGMALDFIDIEDAFICAVASAAKADVIITRNVRDFSSSPVPVVTPREFLAAWQAAKPQLSAHSSAGEP